MLQTDEIKFRHSNHSHRELKSSMNINTESSQKHSDTSAALGHKSQKTSILRSPWLVCNVTACSILSIHQNDCTKNQIIPFYYTLKLGGLRRQSKQCNGAL